MDATRQAALSRLKEFLPKTGRDYTRLRNYDLGAEGHPHVSRLSPYIRHRLLTEEEVLEAVLGRFSLSTADKFVQEVFWRTYWKGWLELRPSVWTDYRRGVEAAWNRVQTESGLRAEWEAACRGETGIDGFDHWAQELVETGYLHNHARMWFASIWVFTLRLPWELGADFFLRHLLDGDPASNTLGWRWVAGIQTRGKTYLARSSNISKYTNGRFRAEYQLASSAPPIHAAPPPPPMAPPEDDRWDRDLPTALLLTDEDLSLGHILGDGLRPIASAALSGADARSPLAVSEAVLAFTCGAICDAASRYADRIGPFAGIFEGETAVLDAAEWARQSGARQVVTAYVPVGPAAERLAALRAALEPDGITVRTILRPFDARAWPYATHGYFKFKEKIPRLVSDMKGIRAA